MLKIKYLFPLFVAMLLFSIFMPDEWYYEYIGPIESIETIEDKETGSKTHTIKYIDKKTGERRVDEISCDTWLYSYIESFECKKMFKARYYLNPGVFGIIVLIFGLVGLIMGLEECGSGGCSYCPVYIFCSSKDKEHSHIVQYIRNRMAASAKKRKDSIDLKHKIY